MNMNLERLLGALARGYCSDRNSHKVLDGELIEDMATEIKKEFDDPFHNEETAARTPGEPS